MTEGEWIALAERRVGKVLQARRFASIRQLEKKISEGGPADMRPEPVKISKAISRMARDGNVLSEQAPNLPTFYKPPNFGSAGDDERREEILRLTRDFLTLTRNRELCGNVLEGVVKAAALKSGQYRVISPAKQRMELDGYVLEKECDHVLFPKTFVGPTLVVEDKNLREWLTPSSEEVWALIGNALRVPDAIPVLICRRMHYVGFRIFKRMGLACWQVYRQYFDRSVEAQLVPMRHKDGLGFSDLTSSADPPAPLVRFFEHTLRLNAEAFREQFEASRELLRWYAIDNGLENDEMVTKTRTSLFEDFRRELFPRDDDGYGNDSPPEYE